MSDADRLNDISLSIARGQNGPPAPRDAAAHANISKAMGYAKGGHVAFGKSSTSWFGPGKPGGTESKYSKRGK